MKINLGLEVPIAHLDEVSPHVDFHFVIATTARDYPEYLAYYSKQNRENRNDHRTVMLDNGAFEAHAKGEEPVPMNALELFDIAQEIQPDLVWAPDHPFNRKDTEHLSRVFRKLAWDKDVDWEVGFIPQGRTAEEIAESLEEEGDTYDHIGLSFLNDREAVIRLMWSKLLSFRVHMLGYSHLSELQMMPRLPGLSIDTSKPLKAAKLVKKLDELQKGEGLLLPTDIITDRNLMIANLKLMRGACNGFE